MTGRRRSGHRAGHGRALHPNRSSRLGRPGPAWDGLLGLPRLVRPTTMERRCINPRCRKTDDNTICNLAVPRSCCRGCAAGVEFQPALPHPPMMSCLAGPGCAFRGPQTQMPPLFLEPPDSGTALPRLVVLEQGANIQTPSWRGYGVARFGQFLIAETLTLDSALYRILEAPCMLVERNASVTYCIASRRLP